MDNKLSELSNPKAFVVTGGKMYQDRAFTDKSTAERSKADRNDGSEVEPLYSQEYVSALLAELEAKDKHIADMENVVAAAKCDDELWDAMAHRLKTLEAKLATPVRLQSPWVDKVGNRWLLEGTTADVIRAAGFAVTVEGDEQ